MMFTRNTDRSLTQLDDAAEAAFRADPNNLFSHEAGVGDIAMSAGEIASTLASWNAPPTKDELIARAKQNRWEKETSGVTLGGIVIATDDRSKSLIVGGFVAAQVDPTWTTIWEAADGTSHPLDAATMIAIGNAVAEHVSACFLVYAKAKTAIEDGTIITLAQVDATFA